jgi:hypothetical protein
MKQGDCAMTSSFDPHGKTQNRFPFRRQPQARGTWAAQDATEDNIEGTSVDRYQPVWPRWKKTPPPDLEGEFISDEPFFDIDEIAQTAKFYAPGTPLVDKNLDGNPATRQRDCDFPAGTHWRRRLLVGDAGQADGWQQTRMSPDADRPLVLAQAIPRNPDGTWPAPEATEENIRGTSVDRDNPVWPRWTQTPDPGRTGNFISDEYYYLIDEVTGRVRPMPPGTPLPDLNQDGNPLRARRTNDTPAGNVWRQRLNVWRGT